jgi:predicted acylesterase/phospholipase RssA
MSNTRTSHFKNCLGVFQGGGCKALAFIGAYQEAKERGVFFSEVAGTSAGSIFAAMVAAGATPSDMQNAVLKTDFNKFLAPASKQDKIKGYGGLKFAGMFSSKANCASKFMQFLGLYSSSYIEEWLNDILLKLTGRESGTVTFLDLKLPLYVISTDVSGQKQKVWSYADTPNESVAKAVRCSCSIPIFFQPVDGQYVDGALVSNLPTFSLNKDEHHFEKILCFTLKDKASDIKCYKTYLSNIIGSVVDGAFNIQELYQNNAFYIEIDNLPLSTTSFDDVDANTISEMIDKGKSAASTFFNEETLHITKKINSSFTLSKDFIYNSIVLEDPSKYDSLLISSRDTKFAYSLFPTILSWVEEKKPITFLTQSSDVLDSDERYRRFLLRKFGINLIEKEEVPFTSFLFCSSDDNLCKSIVFNNKSSQSYGSNASRKISFGSIYQGEQHQFVQGSLLGKLCIQKAELNFSTEKNYSIVEVNHNELKRDLKSLTQYRKSTVEIQKRSIQLSDVKLMTKYVKSYKYNQIEKLNSILSTVNLTVQDFCVLEFSDGTTFPVTPIIIEKHGSDYIVVKGNSRLCFLYRELEADKFNSLIVTNVVEPLPSPDSYQLNDLISTTRNVQGDSRYGEFNYQQFRHIEKRVRSPEKYL